MRVLTGGAIAISAALNLQVPVAAQRGARPPMFPTKDQFENTSSSTGPPRAALARQDAALPPLKDYTMTECATARVIALEQASGRTH
jgi:hypothetical protein